MNLIFVDYQIPLSTVITLESETFIYELYIFHALSSHSILGELNYLKTNCSWLLSSLLSKTFRFLLAKTFRFLFVADFAFREK